MNNTIGMTILQSEKQLVNDAFDLFFIENDSLQVFLQITINILEDEVEFVLGWDHFLEVNDVGVSQLFEQRNLAHCSWRYSLIFMI